MRPHETSSFARWTWTPRTAQSAVETAYAIERHPAQLRRDQPHRIADIVLGMAIGILGAAALVHWWAA
jgi:hypothetical protein